jgi:DHA2 family multidrug resistance protein-like MFS transporter
MFNTLRKKREWVGLAVLVLPCLLVSMHTGVVTLAAPRIAADLHPTGAQSLWIVDSYVFMVAGSLLVMGVLGDRIGRRRLLLVGAVLFSVGCVLAAFATSPAMLIAARLLTGLAGASLMPSTLALIRVLFADRRRRTVALGVWSIGFSLGGLVAPLVGGMLLDRFWWGSVFLIALPITVPLIVLGPRLLPESRDPGATGVDLFGAAQSLAAVLAVVYALKRAAEGGWHPDLVALVVIGGALGYGFVRRQLRRPDPMLDLSMFRDTAFRTALLSNALAFFVLYGTQLPVIQYLQWSIGLSPWQAGLWTVPSVLAYLTGSALGPVLARRLAPERVIGAGLVAVAAGFSVLTQVGTTHDLAVIVTGSSILSLGLAPVYTLTTDLIVSNARPERAGAAGAITETGAELGGALGIALLGSLGLWVYRRLVGAAVDGLPIAPASDARRSLGDATAVAGGLPAPQSQELLDHARHAFQTAFAVVAGTATVIIVVLAVVVTLTLRTRRSGPDPVPGRRSPADARGGPR